MGKSDYIPKKGGKTKSKEKGNYGEKTKNAMSHAVKKGKEEQLNE